jgi:membrane associated rhomboid family serine protease
MHEYNSLHEIAFLSFHVCISDTTKIFDHAQFYRIFTCNLTFGSMGELLFGLAALCPLLRRFEREVRTKDVFHLAIY